VLATTPALRDLIANARPAAEVHAQALADGMLPFRHAALLQVARGRTTTEEIFRAIPTEQLLHTA
jgi:type II secretory ATPase GspE/PulE/Tfp pilus assembly ATPase PilB-like protein